MFHGRFPVASSYRKLVKAVYRQRMYLYFVQFSGILHCRLQRYHARIRTLGSSLVSYFDALQYLTYLLFPFKQLLTISTVWVYCYAAVIGCF